ncbi:MAG: hypothetical protein ACU0CO_01830 [Shimia sp.]
MDNGLIIILPLATFAAFLAFALWSKGRTEKRKDDDAAPKSSLAVDGDSHRKAP